MQQSKRFAHQEWVDFQKEVIAQMKKRAAVSTVPGVTDLVALNLCQQMVGRKHAEVMEKLPGIAVTNQWVHAFIGSTKQAYAEDDFEDLPGHDSILLFVDVLRVRFADVLGRFREKLRHVRQKYADHDDYDSYRGFTVKMTTTLTKESDFPGEDSLNAFFDQLYSELSTVKTDSPDAEKA